MAKRKPKTKPEPAAEPEAAEPTEAAQGAEPAELQEALTEAPDLARMQRGMAALHRSFKEYKAMNDQRFEELRGMLERIGVRMRGGA